MDLMSRYAFTSDYELRHHSLCMALAGKSNALGNILSGKVTPSGKLSDTIAKKYEDYPSASSFGGKEYNEYKEVSILTGF